MQAPQAGGDVSGQPAAPARSPGHALWPRPCLGCGRWERGALCRACHQHVIALAPARCPRCALPSPGAQVCGACRLQPPPWAACVAAGVYGHPWDRWIQGLKFHQRPELAGPLAALLAPLVATHLAGGAAPQRVLPVPLGPARLAARGYNQAWELARRLARRLGLPARADVLLRLHETPSQVGSDRAARLANLRDAFWVPPPAAAALKGQRLALVDDVVTTGATAAAATHALLHAGAAEVQVWVLARTPAPGDTADPQD